MSKTPNAETVDLLRSFDTPTIANAIEAFNVRNHTEGYASSELHCQFPDLPPMVGYAVTCTADSTTPKPVDSNHVTDLFDAVAAAPKPVVVVVQHKGPDRSKSCFVGDIVCTALLKLGAVGFVTDGGVRDLAGIRRRAPGFQLFAGGLVVSHGALVYLEVGVPISVCGLSIRPGDLLHGDESGLVLIPPEVVESLPEHAQAVQKRESQFIDFLDGAPWSVDELKTRFTRK